MAAITVTKTKIRRLDFSDVTSPILRWSEIMPNVVVSGGITSAGASLVGTISALVALVDGRRVTVAETSKTFTASKDTYVDVGYSESATGVITGALAYSAVNNDAGEPSLAAGHIRLMKVVTDGSAITSVYDMRALNAGFGMGAPVGV